MRIALLVVGIALHLIELSYSSAVQRALPAESPFEWFEPWVRIGASDLRAMGRGEVVIKVLPGETGQHALFLGGVINVDPDQFVRKVRDSEALWKGDRVPQVVRFSDPPRLEDLSALRLDEVDLSALRECRPGRCAIKLAAAEIERLQATQVRASGDWRSAVQQEFRQLVFDRVAHYASQGLGGLADFHDHAEPVNPLTVSSRLFRSSPWISERVAPLREYFEQYPRGLSAESESFIYWMMMTYPPKPTLQVFHVVVHRSRDSQRPVPEALVVSRLVFATHYVNASVALTALLGDAANSGRRYLAYVNVSHVDGFGGWLSGLRRFFVERRIRGAAESMFRGQRRRLEE